MEDKKLFFTPASLVRYAPGDSDHNYDNALGKRCISEGCGKMTRTGGKSGLCGDCRLKRLTNNG